MSLARSISIVDGSFLMGRPGLNQRVRELLLQYSMTFITPRFYLKLDHLDGWMAMRIDFI